MVDVSLTEREVRIVLGWRRTGAFFPDEERVLRRLRTALEADTAPALSRLQLQILLGWAEEQVEGHYGGGAVLNPDESAILAKVRAALEPGP